MRALLVFLVTVLLSNYWPVLIFLILMIFIGALIPLASKLVSFFTGVTRPSVQKNSTYECGFEPFEEARTRFDVKFYLVAMLFIIFDIEVAFLFPWAVVIHRIGWAGFSAMGIFIGLLVAGFIYEWKKGALSWE